MGNLRENALEAKAPSRTLPKAEYWEMKKPLLRFAAAVLLHNNIKNILHVMRFGKIMKMKKAKFIRVNTGIW